MANANTNEKTVDSGRKKRTRHLESLLKRVRHPVI